MVSKTTFKGLLTIIVLLFAATNYTWAQEIPDVTYTLRGENVYPEGIAYDSKTESLFVGSFYKGEIQHIQKGNVTVFVPAGQDELHSVVGLFADAKRRRLWVCNSEAGASQRATPESIGKASVHIYNLDSKALLKRIAFTQQSGHFCNDIALDANGNAYITDSFSPIIWKVGSTDFVLSEFVNDDKFRGEGFNLNGIRITPDGKYLITVKMNSGQLFRISLKDRSVIEIKLNRPIDAGDGMIFSGKRELLVVEGFGAKEPGIATLIFSKDYSSATISKKLQSPKIKVPTTITIADGRLFVVNSQFNHLFKPEESGPPEPSFSIVGFDLKRLKQQGGVTMKKVLFVVTNHDKLGNTGKQTGFYLPEVSHPHKVLTEKGFEIDFVSPKGGKAPMDGVDLNDPINKSFLNNKSYVAKVENTLAPNQVNPADYAAIFYAGGHGTMWDFPDNEKIAKIASAVYENGGVVAAVCHGPAGLVNIKLSNGKYLVDGKTVSSFTNEEEKAVGLANVVPFLLESMLIERGARHTKAPLWQSHVEVSERLVTGQNPASAEQVGKAMVKLLSK
ncbi:MAG: DJ-1/PfpI family protein [Nitrospirota bacterium]